MLSAGRHLWRNNQGMEERNTDEQLHIVYTIIAEKKTNKNLMSRFSCFVFLLVFSEGQSENEDRA